MNDQINKSIQFVIENAKFELVDTVLHKIFGFHAFENDKFERSVFSMSEKNRNLYNSQEHLKDAVELFIEARIDSEKRLIDSHVEVAAISLGDSETILGNQMTFCINSMFRYSADVSQEDLTQFCYVEMPNKIMPIAQKYHMQLSQMMGGYDVQKTLPLSLSIEAIASLTKRGRIKVFQWDGDGATTFSI